LSTWPKTIAPHSHKKRSFSPKGRKATAIIHTSLFIQTNPLEEMNNEMMNIEK